MKNRYKHKGIWFSWILSDLLILIIPLMVNIFAYTKSIEIIEDGIGKVHMASLKQLQQVMDSKLRDIERVSLEIALNDKVKVLMGTKQPINPYQRLTQIDTIKDIKTYKIANAHIDGLYIYFKYNDFILGPDGRYTPEEFYQFFCQNYNIDFKDWLKMLNTWHEREYIPLGGKDLSSDDIIFIRSLPMAYLGQAEANVVTVMHKDTLLKGIEEIAWTYQGDVIVLDKNNNPVITTREFENVEVLHSQFDGEQDIFYQKLNKQKVAISYVTSKITGWKYVSILPTQVFLDKAGYIKRIVMISIFICVFLGGYISYFFSRRNYNPIKKMVDMLIDKGNIPSSKEKNEFSFIEKSILQVIHEKEQMTSQLDKQKETLRDNFLVRLLKDNLKEYIPMQETCQEYNLSFNYDRFVIMLFYIEDCSQIFFEQQNKEDDKILEMAQFIMKNMIEELMNEYNQGYMLEVDNVLTCIANFENEEIAKKRIDEVIAKAKELMEGKFHIFFSVAISDVHIGYNGLPLAYNEAIEAFEYNMIMGQNSAIYYSDMISENATYSGSTINEYQKFINAIKANSYKEAEYIFYDLINQDFATMIPSSQMLKCKMFGLVNLMMMAMEETSISHDKGFWEELRPVERLLKCNTITSLKAEINCMFTQIDQYVEDEDKNQSKKLVKDISSFVEKNYHDNNLNVSRVAEEFNFNQSYLSRFFKTQTGVGLLDHIHQIRIAHAKKMMKSHKRATVQEIAKQAGYYNDIAFIRAFKRYEGITPGRYKEIEEPEKYQNDSQK